MPVESQIGHFQRWKLLVTINGYIDHNSIFISHNATFCDVNRVLKFLIKKKEKSLLHPEEAEWRNVGVLNENIMIVYYILKKPNGETSVY